MNYLFAFLCLGWIFFAFADKQRAPLFALLALASSIQVCKSIMLPWLFGVLMLLVGAGICGAAYYYYTHKAEDKFGAALDIVIGVLTCTQGIMTF